MHTTDSAKAAKLAAIAAQLSHRLKASGDKYTTRAQIDLFDLCNAVIDLIDDGDCMAQRESLMDELRCDEDGNPVDENRERIIRASFGMHHPDSPSFGGRV